MEYYVFKILNITYEMYYVNQSFITNVNLELGLFVCNFIKKQ